MRAGLVFLLALLTACKIPSQHPTLRSVWSAGNRHRYYVDTATVATDSAGRHVVGYDVTSDFSSTWGRYSAPRLHVRREELSFRCGSDSVTGSSITTTETVASTDQGAIGVFSGRADPAGPQAAAMRYACTP
jgi:hypothetical protein